MVKVPRKEYAMGAHVAQERYYTSHTNCQQIMDTFPLWANPFHTIILLLPVKKFIIWKGNKHVYYVLLVL